MAAPVPPHRDAPVGRSSKTARVSYRVTPAGWDGRFREPARCFLSAAGLPGLTRPHRWRGWYYRHFTRRPHCGNN